MRKYCKGEGSRRVGSYFPDSTLDEPILGWEDGGLAPEAPGGGVASG